MRTDVGEALRRLRAADPAAEVPDEQWSGSAAEARTKQRDPQQVVHDAPAPGARRMPRWPAAVAAAAVVAGISVAAVELSDEHGAVKRPLAGPSAPHSQRPTPTATIGSPPTTTSPPAPSGPDPHKLAAQRFVRRLLDAAPVLPHAQQRATAPTALLRRAAAPPRTTNPLIARAGHWFTAPGTMDAAIAYLTAHVPAGMTFDGTGTGSRYGVVTSESISYTEQAVASIRDAYLWIFVAPYRGGVGVGMYATAYWVPTRPPGYLIEDATSVTVTVRRGGSHPPRHSPHARTVHRRLTGSVVGTLSRAVNRLQPAYLFDLGCPFTWRKHDDTLVFATPTGSARVFDSLTSCANVALRFTDGRHLALDDPADLNAAVLRALGLPRNYGMG